VRLTCPVRAAVVGLAALSVVAVGGYTAGASTGAPPPTRVVVNLPAPAVAPNPLIANGVSIGKNVAVYKSSGLGPGALNAAAPAGTPERYVDPSQFPGGALSAGVTITEAQSMNALARIAENLASVGLGVDDVITMRVFLDNPPGADVADYAGWNRAYRQFFANTDRVTRAVLPVPLGTAPAAPPLVANAARPSRFTLEVASLPVAGWLVEVEVDAAFPR
jgi:enamine deaminase RidA (YjgF/YER057c/UK114 family)